MGGDESMVKQFRFSELRKSIADLKAVMPKNIPTTDSTGKRCWIPGGSSGLNFCRKCLVLQRDHGELVPLEAIDSDLRQQIELWSRAEVRHDINGAIFVWNRQISRQILGLHDGGSQ
jgi:hypothetical protein